MKQVQEERPDRVPRRMRRMKKRQRSVLWICTAVACLAMQGMLVAAVLSWRAPQDAFEQKKQIVSRPGIAQGVYLDGLHLGGMTREEARSRLKQDENGMAGHVCLIVNIDEMNWVLTDTELGLRRNTEKLLDVAMAVGRQGDADTAPMEYRYEQLYHVASHPLYMFSEYTYDRAVLESLAKQMAQAVNEEPVNARVASYTTETREFGFTDDRAGRHIDAGTVANAIAKALDGGNYTAEINLKTEKILPDITKAELMSSFALMASTKINCDADKAQQRNIAAAARKMTGTTVVPGQEFSFAASTGLTDSSVPYETAVDLNDDGPVRAGGVSYLATALFQTLLKADLPVSGRSECPCIGKMELRGLDAWAGGEADLRFVNGTDLPMFIVSETDGRECTVYLYGRRPENGLQCELETEITDVTAPEEAMRLFCGELEPGTEHTVQEARVGYTVKTWRVYKKGGSVTRREPACVSVYPARQEITEYRDRGEE